VKGPSSSELRLLFICPCGHAKTVGGFIRPTIRMISRRNCEDVRSFTRGLVPKLISTRLFNVWDLRQFRTLDRTDFFVLFRFGCAQSRDQHHAFPRVGDGRYTARRPENKSDEKGSRLDTQLHRVFI